MGDFRTVIFYKSEDAMDGVDFDNPHQYDTDDCLLYTSPSPRDRG